MKKKIPVQLKDMTSRIFYHKKMSNRLYQNCIHISVFIVENIDLIESNKLKNMYRNQNA